MKTIIPRSYHTRTLGTVETGFPYVRTPPYRSLGEVKARAGGCAGATQGHLNVRNPSFALGCPVYQSVAGNHKAGKMTIPWVSNIELFGFVLPKIAS